MCAKTSHIPWIVAHRGAKVDAPENTLSSFESALNHPIDGIEFDVQLTRDGVPVLFHDHTLTRINGSSKRVSECTLEELLQLDWGRWFSDSFRGEPLMTLERVLELFAHRTRLMVEIKVFEEDRSSGRSVELTNRVVELIRSTEVTGDLFILSFDPDVLRHAHRSNPRWHYVLNADDARSGAVNQSTPDDHFYAYCGAIEWLDQTTVERWHSSAKKVMTYSCNSPDEARKALALGCDVIMTDNPGWMVGFLESENLRQ